MDITEEEKVGIQVIAMIREGLLNSFKCSACTEDLQEIRNCKGKSDFDSSVFAHPLVGEFYACPMIMIPPSIYTWLDQYDYYEKYPSAAPNYGEVNPRFWGATKYYEQFKYELKEHNNKGVGDEKTTSNNMSKMASLFKR